LLANIQHAPHNVSVLVPGLQGESCIARFHGDVVAGDGKDFFAGLEQCGLFGGVEKTLDCRLEFLGAAAGNPPGGGFIHF
jgi:hypothetical protein